MKRFGFNPKGDTPHSPERPQLRLGARVLLLLLPLLLLFPHITGMAPYRLLDRLEQQIYDMSLRQMGQGYAAQDDRIVIVDIDEASLQQLGHWPWPRSTLAQIVNELAQRQRASVVGLDILLAETERDVQRLGDTALQQQVAQHPIFLGYYYDDKNPTFTGKLPAPLSFAGEPPAFSQVPLMKGYIAPLPELVERASGSGFLNAVTESDGVLRSIPLLARRTSESGAVEYYPALSLAMYMQVAQVSQPQLVVTGGEGSTPAVLHGVRLGAREIPVTKEGSFMVPFRSSLENGKPRYRYISAREVVAGQLQEGELAGRIVLVGTSAPGLRDIHVTPVGVAYPGVEVHASAIAAMLDQRFLQVPDYTLGFELFNMLVLGSVLLVLLLRTRAFWGLMSTLAVVGVHAVLHVWLFFDRGLVMPVAATLVMLLTMYVLHSTQSYFYEQRVRRQLVYLFGRYVPRELAERMAASPSSYSAKARAKELSVMFCDVQGFTHLSESMEPLEVQELLNDVFNRIAQVIAEHQGTIDKFMGDSVMVFWGAPLDDAEHASHAIQTGLAIHAMLEAYNSQRTEAQLPPLSMSIGVNTGVMSVGDIGSDLRRNYTVIGDAVNVASRLESLCSVYGVPIVAGEQTRVQLPQFAWQWLDCVRLVGKERPVNIYVPLTLEDAEMRSQELAHWSVFQEAWRTGNWDQCETLLHALRALQPNRTLYRLYQRRVNVARYRVGNDWDGITRLDSKQPRL